MNVRSVALALCLLSASAISAQESVEGYWEGALVRDGAVRVLRIDIARDGEKLQASVRTPDWIADRPPAAVTQDGAKVRMELEEQTATMVLDSVTGEMIGTHGETTPPVRVHLKRAIRPVRMAIRTEDVRFKSGEVTLAGTLVTPTTGGPHPAIVWLHGRGQATRGGHRGWARLFAERGVASLIYDKRGGGESTGNYTAATMQNLAADAMAAVEFLAARAEIDPKQIGVRGNSAGGWVAFIVATHSKVPLAFVITTVGPADSVMDQQIHVSAAMMRQSNIAFTPEEYAAAAAHMQLLTNVAYTGKGWEELRKSNERAKKARWASFVDTPESDQDEGVVWIRNNQYDPAPDLKQLKTPFLALYGERDYVVPPEDNVPKLERYLKEAGNSDFKIVVIPATGHALSFSDEVRKIGDPKSENYYWLWPKLSAIAAQLQIDWLLSHVRLAAAG
jgi:dipeptidyl aminopeptidase/acylaminoacyl peptidase